jgi:hypothetical protein
LNNIHWGIFRLGWKTMKKEQINIEILNPGQRMNMEGNIKKKVITERQKLNRGER